MKIRSAVLEGPRNPGRWPILRKPPKLHAREDSRLHTVALDAVDVHPSISPETDARASTTWCLQPPSASLVLWRKPRNPPSIGARASSPGVDAAATAWPELRSRLPFTAVHRTVHRPQHLHGSSPSTLDARVPATKDQAHDHTARLIIHSSQPGESTPHSSIYIVEYMILMHSCRISP